MPRPPVFEKLLGSLLKPCDCWLFQSEEVLLFPYDIVRGCEVVKVEEKIWLSCLHSGVQYLNT